MLRNDLSAILSKRTFDVTTTDQAVHGKTVMKKALRNGVLAILTGALCVIGYLIYNEDAEHAPAKKEWESLQEQVVIQKQEKKILTIDWNSLLASNPDVVGWIYVPGCGINYPILQDNSNTYYLNHTLYRTYDSYGSIFLSASNNKQFTDDNSIIYGHSVQYVGGMFTGLKNYADSSFYENHPYFYLLTPVANYKCKVKSFAKTTEDSTFYKTHFSEGEKSSILSKMQSEAQFSSLNQSDLENGLITLSTCDLDYGLNSNHRLLLVGSKEITKEEINLE